MNRKIFAFNGFIFAGAMLLTIPAMARDNCTTVPSSEWKSINEITTHAEKLGYTVRKVERDGTCYEVEGTDRNGAKIEILYNPETGTPVPHR